jgi:GNAT superfamily N-acetyltransferase
MQIRKATPVDLPDLRKLAEDTFRIAWQAENHPIEFERYCEKAFTIAQLGAEMAHKQVAFYLVYWENKLAAYLKLNLNKSAETLEKEQCTQIERVYVLPDFQSKGLGAAMLQYAEKEAKNAGSSWIWLSVWQKSPRSVAFYERNGYEIFGVETFWVGDDPQPDWLMKKALA